MSIRRINLYAGPGCGKTSQAAGLFYALKSLHKNIEHVSEYIKEWAWLGFEPSSFDQVYILAKQMRQEDVVLRNGANLIITECPLLLSVVYSRMNGLPGWESLWKLGEVFEQQFPSLNIFMQRGDKPYRQEGRYHTLEQAIEIDNLTREFLTEGGVSFTDFAFDDHEGMLSHIIASIFHTD